MGDIADYYLEQEMMAMAGDDLYDWPYPASRKQLTKPQLAELARQAERDGNIHEQAMRGLSLAQVLARSKR